MPTYVQRTAKWLGLPSLILSIAGMLMISFGLLFAQTAQAADPKPTIRDARYHAAFVSQSESDPITIEAGKEKTVSITFKNAGTVTWNASSANYISAYTMEPRYRESAFRGSNWLSSKQTAKISGVVAPGKTGTLSVQLKAPEKTGEYIERFYLASENNSWVKGGYFYLKMNVVPAKAEPVVKGDKIENDTVVESTVLKGKRIFINRKEVSAKGGDPIRLIFGVQNLSNETWKSYSLSANAPTALAASTKLTFADNTWLNDSVVKKGSILIEPYKSLRQDFMFRAPAKKGTYTLAFTLRANDKDIDGVVLEVPVTVTSDAPSHFDAPKFVDTNTPIHNEVPRLNKEPHIRVGLWKNPENNTAQFVSYDDDYIVYAGNTKKGELEERRVAVLKYTGGVYSFDGGDLDFRSNDYIRLVPKHDPSAVFTLLNYDRAVTWKGPNNFNTYRGNAELRVTNDKSAVYLINELLMEDYVAGIGENASFSPMEYLKSQTVAQRTYAYFVKEYTTKHDARNFDVVAHTGDQLYLGRENEILMPRFVEAQKATRGYMVTYDDDIVITPYFGNSDGKTRSWQQVWGGSPKPWLVPVTAEYDNGRRLFGHGVGMSQRDAAYRADEEGSTWEELIKHYYTGVEIEKIYK